MDRDECNVINKCYAHRINKLHVWAMRTREAITAALFICNNLESRIAQWRSYCIQSALKTTRAGTLNHYSYPGQGHDDMIPRSVGQAIMHQRTLLVQNGRFDQPASDDLIQSNQEKKNFAILTDGLEGIPYVQKGTCQTGLILFNRMLWSDFWNNRDTLLPIFIVQDSKLYSKVFIPHSRISMLNVNNHRHLNLAWSLNCAKWLARL